MGYKLTYFDMRGRAEGIRLMFVAAGVEFEDVRFKKEEWMDLKPKTNWGQVPFLEVDGVQLAQTTTIFRYLGHKFNLAGEDDWEAAKCDEYADASNDLLELWGKFLYEQDPVKKAELTETFLTTQAPNFLRILESVQQKNGGTFLVGKNMTWADINLADKLQMLEDTVKVDILEEYPNLKKMKNAVFSQPRLKDYIEKTAYSYKSLLTKQ